MKGVMYYILALVLMLVAFVYDKTIVMAFAQNHVAWMTVVYLALTYLGSVIYVPFVVFVVYLWAEHEKKYIVPLAYGVLVTFVLAYAMKEMFMRPRPYEVLNIVPVVGNFASYSFPSMHAALAFAFLPVLNKVFRKNLLWTVVVAGVAVSRLYLGVHYLSDIIAGAVLGYGIAKFFLYAMDKKWFRRFVFIKND